MSLSLDRIEENVLLLHMSISRKNIKKGFKRNYKKDEYKQHLKTFDDICTMLKINMEFHLQDVILTDYYLNNEELEMIYSFVTWYIQELKKLLENAGIKANEEDKQHFINFEKIKAKLEQLGCSQETKEGTAAC